MARQARGQSIDPQSVQVVHCIQRCVRQAFLCGFNAANGKSYEHRRGWIRERLQLLASVFAIDCLTYAVMENHVHQVLRSRPDVLATWSDHEVARRWLRLCPARRKRGKGAAKVAPSARLPAAEPEPSEIEAVLAQPGRVQELRRRLSDLSWWMRMLAQNIAYRSNREEEVEGYFWQGRFRSQLVLDEASLLACAAYVDLNPIRAAMATTPESSLFTGVKDRLDDWAEARPAVDAKDSDRQSESHHWERASGRRHSGWLSPLEIDESNDPTGPDPDPADRRASQKGFLPLSLAKYFQLLDWTGRQISSSKRGHIPEHLAPILTRLGLDASRWVEVVHHFGRFYKRAAGSPEQLRAEAARRGQRWLQVSRATSLCKVG